MLPTIERALRPGVEAILIADTLFISGWNIVCVSGDLVVLSRKADASGVKTGDIETPGVYETPDDDEPPF